ncbi:unnamed protein product [Musa acuminata var. zebrina]
MICAISGEVPEDPVLSKKSGLLFERRLIEHHIASHGKCPITKEELTMDDLIPVKTNKVVKPRPLQAASIPGLLGMFQNEWDALMLSNFALEQQLHTARQELSHALYQVLLISCSWTGYIVFIGDQSFVVSLCAFYLFLCLLVFTTISCAIICSLEIQHCLGNLNLETPATSFLDFLCKFNVKHWGWADFMLGSIQIFLWQIGTVNSEGKIDGKNEMQTLERFASFFFSFSCLKQSLSIFINPDVIKFETWGGCQVFVVCSMLQKLHDVICIKLHPDLFAVIFLVLSAYKADHFCCTDCIVLQHDAACRVIARLKKERDEARMLLAQAERQIPLLAASAANATTAVSNGKRAAEDDLGPDGKKIRPGINPVIIAELTECNALLSGQRKKRQIPTTLASVDALERYTQISSHPLHKTNKPGILSIDIDASKDIIATGGIDTNGVLFNRASGQMLSTLSGHSKKVTSVKFVPGNELIVTGSSDKTVRVWQGTENGNYDCQHVMRDHTAEVQAVTVHATQKYFVTASMDNTWCFYDLSTGSCLTQVGEASTEEGYTSASFHPDGLILGTGTTGAIVKIWDVKSQSNVAKFDGHVGSVTAMSFSENGYFLATAAMDGVKLWDLRKLRNFRSFAPYDPETPTNYVEFDSSGSYLAIAGSDVRVYQVANVKLEWNLIKILPDLSGTGKVSCVKFGADAKYMAVGSMDRNLRIFGLPGDESEEPKSPDH